MTGICWDEGAVDWNQIPHVGIAAARVRFRAVLPEHIWNAGALEGNAITLAEVRSLLAGVTVPGHRIADEEQILALSEGYTFVDELVGVGEFGLEKSASDRVQGLIARHEAIEAGHFRGEGVVSGGGSVLLASGGSVAGVPAAELPGRWERLHDFLTGIDDVRARALIFNAAATRAQFYFDGNKRTARLMMTGILLTAGYDAINIPHARRLEYNLALDELFTTDDATALLAFIASCAHNPDRP